MTLAKVNVGFTAIYLKEVPIQKGFLIYNGEEQSPRWYGYDPDTDSDILKLEGDTSAIDAGVYTAQFTPIVRGRWLDMSKVTKTIDWSIEKADLKLTATVSGTIKYNEIGTITVSGNSGNGTVRAFSENGCIHIQKIDNNIITIKCTKYSESPVKITILVDETNNYKNSLIEVLVHTQKAEAELTIGSTDIVLTAADFNKSIDIGTNNTDLPKIVEIDNSSFNIVHTGYDSEQSKLLFDTSVTVGSATVTVSTPASTNFTKASKEITVSVTSKPTYNDMLLNRSLENVAQIFKDGKGAEYFKPGDYFTFKLATTSNFYVYSSDFSNNSTVVSNSYTTLIPGMTMRAVLMGINHNADIEGNNKGHFFIDNSFPGLRNHCLYGIRAKRNTSAAGWQLSYLRSWLTDVFYYILPEELRNLIVPCYKMTDNMGNGSNTASNVTKLEEKTLWTFSEYEVLGTRTNANSAESTNSNQLKYAYFDTSNTRVRYYSYSYDSVTSGSSSMSSAAYWTRSPYYNNTSSWACISTGGVATTLSSTVSTGAGIVPCFCLGE